MILNIYESRQSDEVKLQLKKEDSKTEIISSFSKSASSHDARVTDASGRQLSTLKTSKKLTWLFGKRFGKLFWTGQDERVNFTDETGQETGSITEKKVARFTIYHEILFKGQTLSIYYMERGYEGYFSVYDTTGLIGMILKNVKNVNKDVSYKCFIKDDFADLDQIILLFVTYIHKELYCSDYYEDNPNEALGDFTDNALSEYFKPEWLEENFGIEIV